MKIIVQRIIFAGILFSLLSSPSFGFEIKSRYATLIYKDEKQLLEFNNKALKNISYHGKSVLFADEVTGKLDVLIEEVILILVQSQPTEELKFKIMLILRTPIFRKFTLKNMEKVMIISHFILQKTTQYSSLLTI